MLEGKAQGMMHEIPKSFPEFTRLFPNEEACAAYLFSIRFPEGFACPYCGGRQCWARSTRRTYVCAVCGRDVHLTAGTIIHGSRIPLLTWFYAIFIDTILTPGISAVQFQKALGLTRYETAFQMLHKVRHAMVNPDRDALHGTVQVDETYMGGLRVGRKGGRSLDDKVLVVGAVEAREATKPPHHLYAGRVRFRVVPNAGAKALLGFITDHVVPVSAVVTDGWKSYEGLAKLGYTHLPYLNDPPKELTSWRDLIHLEFSNLKTAIQGTYHGRVEQRHLQAYLNEFAFRHNRRFFTPGFGFLRVLTFGMKGRAPTWDELYTTVDYGCSVRLSGCGECKTAKPQGVGRLARTG